jgi:hypothetical protein
MAVRVRTTFTDILDTPDGMLAELTVAGILLQAAERDPFHIRLARLCAHAEQLLTSAMLPTLRSIPPGGSPNSEVSGISARGLMRG